MICRAKQLTDFYMMETLVVKRLILLKLSTEILLLPLKWKLDLFTLKGMCVEIQKSMSCKTKL